MADGEARFRLLDTIREHTPPNSSRRAARRSDPGAPPRLVRRARRERATASCRVTTSAAGWIVSRSSTTTSGRSSTGRSRRLTRRSRSASPSRCGASGRSTAPRRGPSTPRGDGGGALVARRPASRAQLVEALGRYLLVEGEIALMRPATRRRWRYGSRSAATPRSPTPTTTPRSSTPSPTRVAAGRRSDPDGIGLSYLEQARDLHRIGDRRGEANARWGIGNYEYFQEYDAAGTRRLPCSARHIPRDRRPDDGGLDRCTCSGPALLPEWRCRRSARERRSRPSATSTRRATPPGCTLTLDDMSAIAVAEGDLPRAARLRGAARNLTPGDRGRSSPATSRTRYERRVLRPGSPVHCRRSEDLARYGAEGAALTLDRGGAYALEGSSGQSSPGA